MSKQQKQIAIVAGAAVALYLLYRFYISGSGGTSSTGSAAPDTASSDYAALAGQEQSDVAGLQGQNQQLLGQEQSDVAGLTGQIAGLTAGLGALGDQVNNLATPDLTPIETEIAGLAAGVTQINRAALAQVQTHPGGAFYHYYTRVTGHPPPANVRVTNAVYAAWKAGIPAAARPRSHPSAPKNTSVQHPNPNHTPQRVAGAGAAILSRPKPAAKPPKKPKPKPSGKRR